VKDTIRHHNILIIRSAANTLNSTINSLKKEFPDSRITVFSPESTQESLKNHPNIDAIISAGPANRMSIFNVKKKILQKMRYDQFDLAIALYNIDHGMGYSNIDFLAWVSGAKTIRGYNVRGTFVELSCLGILKKYFLEKTSFTWFIINVFTTIILFALITLGLLFEWSIRKIFTIFSEKKTRSLKQETITASTEHRAFKHS
jgi:hypothetical protein